jgi:hypothetical protein
MSALQTLKQLPTGSTLTRFNKYFPLTECYIPETYLRQEHYLRQTVLLRFLSRFYLAKKTTSSTYIVRNVQYRTNLCQVSYISWQHTSHK